MPEVKSNKHNNTNLIERSARTCYSLPFDHHLNPPHPNTLHHQVQKLEPFEEEVGDDSTNNR